MPNLISSQILSVLFKVSCEAAVLIVLVLAAQWTLGRRLSPRWRHGLWLLVVLRLALPWNIPSSLSLFNYLKFSNVHQSLAVSAVPPTAFAPESIAAETGPGPSHPAAVDRLSLAQGLALAWVAGVGVLLAWMIVTHVLNLLEDCKQRMGVHVPVTLVETAGVNGPCLFGFLRPHLLLPLEFTRHFSIDELRYVFLHELGHVKRQDILLGWLTALLQILHWFNPFVWLAFARMRAERELACDALALAHAGDHESQPYGRTIVKLLESFGGSLRAPSLAGIVESKQQLRERIRMIARFDGSNRGAALAGILFVSLGALTLTDAKPGGANIAATTADESAPPHIVKTIPAAGATDIDPGLKEIKVVFDQDMQAGFSWTGGGADFPPAPDGSKARWRNKRTCVLPVKLEAAHYYRVGINSTSYQNFANLHGLSAMPSAIFFTTKGAGDELKARAHLPQIVRLEPGNGAQNVKPNVSELRLTFDVPMGGGFSWCTVSEDHHDCPAVPHGKGPHWIDDGKTCVLPVELKPGTAYRLTLNDAWHKNFQSTAGVPLEPVAYIFETSDHP